MTRIALAAGPARLDVAPDEGGRLAALSVAGLDLLVDADVDGHLTRWGAFPMAPWAGRVNRGRFEFEGNEYLLPRDAPPHAIHGTVYRRPWDVEGFDDKSCRLSCDFGDDWPFGGRAVQQIELDPGAVHLRLEVHAGERAMPATCGWHPWWRRDLALGGALELNLDLESLWERDRDGIPTGRQIPVGRRPAEGWDDCFAAGSNPPELYWPGAIAIVMASDCPNLVVYDQPTHAVCVEPETGPPDAFNLGHAAVVAPGRPLVATTTWSWKLG